MKERFILDPSKLDTNSGFLCLSAHWQPDPNASNPDMPGQKLVMTSYIPMRADDICLCGSGKTFDACCRQKRYWHPVCPNPDRKGYSLLASQTAKFHPVNGTNLREQLMEDVRLYCVEDRIKKSFWIYWGDPALKDQYGINCFGDIELKQNRTLLVTAMSDLRMQLLLNMLKELAGERLGDPIITYNQMQTIDKWELRKK